LDIHCKELTDHKGKAKSSNKPTKGRRWFLGMKQAN
jgi:hypothetical protein